MNVTDLAEKDIFVLYKLPNPLESATKPPPQPQYGKFSKAFSPPALSSSQPAQDNAPFILPVWARVEEIRLDEPADEVVENVTEIRPGTGEEPWVMDGDNIDVTVVPAMSAPMTVSLADVEAARSEIAETLASSDVAPAISSEAAPTISSESVQPVQTDDSSMAVSATQDDSDAFEVLGPQEDLSLISRYTIPVSRARWKLDLI
ncbi:hypothetical protein FRC12_000342 [Ceratobasidium sp. 428]|nr:hypothetical protein FRC12_000342 [Ceratobasidium sp. 428]